VRSFPRRPGTPDYADAPVNQRGARLHGDIDIPRPLSPRSFDALRSQAAVIDVRPDDVYPAAHVPHSISIPMRDAFCVWLCWTIPAEAALLFVTDGGPIDRVVDESLLVGYEHFAGWLDGGIDAWRGAGLPIATAGLVDAAGARRALLDGAAALDVREPDEYAAGHIDGALHIPLGDLERRTREVPRDRPILAYCGAGERASTAVSLLERAGHAAMNLNGGIDAWRGAGLPIEH
jgi:hydroxyacylglutathione hydrolase